MAHDQFYTSNCFNWLLLLLHVLYLYCYVGVELKDAVTALGFSQLHGLERRGR